MPHRPATSATKPRLYSGPRPALCTTHVAGPVGLDPRDRLLELLDSYGPATGPGMSPVEIMSIVTGRRAAEDQASAINAAYALCIAMRRWPLAKDLPGLLDAYEAATSLELRASRRHVHAFDDLWWAAMESDTLAEADRLHALADAYADYGAGLKFEALAQLAHACALAGLDGVELVVEGPCLV